MTQMHAVQIQFEVEQKPNKNILDNGLEQTQINRTLFKGNYIVAQNTLKISKGRHKPFYIS